MHFFELLRTQEIVNLGRFEKLWQFSSFLVNKGFKIIEVTTSDKLVYDPFPLIGRESNKILLRSIAKGQPMIQEVTYQDRPCKAIQGRIRPAFCPRKGHGSGGGATEGARVFRDGNRRP
jgi:hypothetical protein